MYAPCTDYNNYAKQRQLYMTVRRSTNARVTPLSSRSSKGQAIFNNDAPAASARRPLDSSFQRCHLFRFLQLLETRLPDTFFTRFSLALDQLNPLLARGLPLALQDPSDGLWADPELVREDRRGERFRVKPVELAEAVHRLPGKFFGRGPACREELLEGLSVGFVLVGSGALWRRSLVGRRGAWASAVDDVVVLAEVEFLAVFVGVVLQNWLWTGNAIQRPF